MSWKRSYIIVLAAFLTVIFWNSLTVSPAAADEVVWDRGLGLWAGSGNEDLDGEGLANDRFQQARGFISRESAWGDSRLTLGYDGTFTRFAGNDDFSYSLHNVMAGVNRPIKSVRGSFGVGVDWSGRYDKGIYKYYDHRDFSAYATARGYPVESLLVKGTYWFRSRRLPEIDLLDAIDNQLEVQLSKFFKTRTTVRATVSLGYRLMDDPSVESDSFGGGMGRGRMAGYRAATSPGVGRFNGSIRIAQSLAEMTGAWVEIGYNTITGRGDYEFLADYGYYLSNEILQDEYLFRSRYAKIGLRHIFSFGLDINAVFSFHDRYYPFTPLYSSDGQPSSANRDDSLRILGVYGSQSLDPFKVGPIWYVDFGLARRIDRSNDPYYSFDRSSFYLGMRTSF